MFLATMFPVAWYPLRNFFHASPSTTYPHLQFFLFFLLSSLAMMLMSGGGLIIHYRMMAVVLITNKLWL
jgi:hypothetical protein